MNATTHATTTPFDEDKTLFIRIPRPALAWHELAAASIPLLLVTTLGAVGLAVGLAGAAVNLLIAHHTRGYMLVAACYLTAGMSSLIAAGIDVAIH